MEFGNNQMDEQKLGVLWLRQYPSPLPEPEHLPSKKARTDLVRSVINSSTANSLTNFEDKCISTVHVESVWEFLQSATLQI